MLRVTVQITTSPTTVATLMHLDIQNDGTGTPEVGNYNIELVEHDRQVATKARVEGYPRKERALELIKRAIEKLAQCA